MSVTAEPDLSEMDQQELDKLLAACQESRNRFLPTIVTVAVNTGMRKAEILGLEWERVDFSTSRLWVEHTKSGKPRGVPIPNTLRSRMPKLSAPMWMSTRLMMFW